MSTFVRQPVPCPQCGTFADHDVATSVNAARNPELRQALLDERFQVLTCAACGHAFSFLGEFVYLDFDRRHIIGVFPSSSEPLWPRCERHITEAYEKNLGPSAPVIARPFGERMDVRCVFGLGALREKLVLQEAGLDDVVVEAAKLDLFRSMAGLAVSLERRPRLFEAGDREVAFAIPAVPGDADRRPSRLPVARTALDEFLAAVAGNEELVATLGAGPYVDLGRILLEREETPSG